MTNFGNLSYEELVGILEKTLKYLEPEELEEIATIKTKRVVVDHTKKKISDALSLSDEVFGDIFNKTREFLEAVLTAPFGSPRSIYVEKLHNIWKKFSSIEKALFTVLVIENLFKVLTMTSLYRRLVSNGKDEDEIAKH